MSTSNTISKTGAVLYMIWACLHLLAAYSVYALGRSLDSSMVQARIFQNAWNLLFFSVIAISVAATLNWRNNVWGYWINFATVGIADTGFIFFVLVPGYAPVWPGIVGPVFWVLAAATAELSNPTYQAYRILHLGFTVAPILAGIDKFFHLLCNWDQYLAPWIAGLSPIGGHDLMLTAGAIEAAAGVLVAVRPRLGAPVVGVWLCLIIVNLLSMGAYFDVALRDLGLALGAFALWRLSYEFGR